MDSKVCVNCGNKNAVNATSNRLVTENCGHVKCMQCLLQETSGCIACNKIIDCKGDGQVDIRSDAEKKILESNETNCLNSENSSDRDVLLLIAVENVQGSNPEGKGTEEKLDEGLTHHVKKFKLNTSHIITTTEGSRQCYLCTVCRRKFNARSQINYHAYCNGQKMPYECRECKKRHLLAVQETTTTSPETKTTPPDTKGLPRYKFATQSHYSYHMQSEHGANRKGRYACDEPGCDASFIQKSKLHRHKLVKHTKEKRYMCEECSKAFNNACSLRKHLLTHSGEQPYPCPVSDCTRRFRDTSNLKKHVDNIHKNRAKPARTSQSRYSCREHLCARCPLAFHTRKDLRRHEVIHTEQKPFECSECARDPTARACRRFRRRDNYVRHLRNAHNVHAPPAHAHTHAQNGKPENANKKDTDDACDKAQLEVLNPLPPLPEEVIQKHLFTEDKIHAIDKSTPIQHSIQKSNLIHDVEKETTVERDTAIQIEIEITEIDTEVNKMSNDHQTNGNGPDIDKSYIIEANNARESVIVGCVSERRCASPAPYVHKIRRAHWPPAPAAPAPAQPALPPIDRTKLVQLCTLYPHSKEQPPSCVDVPPLSVKDVQTLKNILHDKPPPAPSPARRTPPPPRDCPKHWRKRLTDTE